MLMIGGALGGLEAQIFPHVAPGFWPLVGLAGVLGGVMRSPLTGVVFALELTHRYEALLPLLIGATAAYAVSILILRRSVLTEKIARRGIHLSREYSVDPLEVLFVGDVMAGFEVGALGERGVAAAADGSGTAANGSNGSNASAANAAAGGPIVFADDTLRHVAYVMAESKRTELPVADRDHPEVPIGTVRLEQLLEGRLRDLDEDRHRSRVLRPMELLGFGSS
jgi:hypothetical protein